MDMGAADINFLASNFWGCDERQVSTPGFALHFSTCCLEGGKEIGRSQCWGIMVGNWLPIMGNR
jgi:hypothetical protein